MLAPIFGTGLPRSRLIVVTERSYLDQSLKLLLDKTPPFGSHPFVIR